MVKKTLRYRLNEFERKAADVRIPNKKLSYKSGSPIKTKKPNYSFLHSLVSDSQGGR